MKSFQLTKKEELNDFIATQKQSQFLQSWEWAEFQKITGEKVIRLGFTEGEKMFFAITLIKNNLPGGLSYLYSPRIGIKDLKDEQLEFVFNEIKKIAKQENIIFLRLDPLFKIQNSLRFGGQAKFKIQKTIDVQPSKTLILDLTRPEEELLKNMHQKTRYNIRLSERKGVAVRSAGPDDFKVWWQIMDATKERDQFRLHGKKYYEKMLSIPFIKLIVAEYKGKIIAGNIMSFFGDTSTYVHGGSSNANRQVMAPFALQWHAIKEAKKQGLKYYDFNGIDEKKWPGVTRFKKGFSGNEIAYPGTFDMVFDNSKYLIYKMLRRIRRWINYYI